MKVSKSYLYFLLILLLTNCADTSEKKKVIAISHKDDSSRIKYGLPLLPDSFVLADYGLDYVSWINMNDSFPKYWTKNIFWDSAGVYMERNYFYKSDTERIQIYCFFRVPKGIDTFGVCHVYQKNLADSGIFLSKIQADSALTKWGLKKQP